MMSEQLYNQNKSLSRYNPLKNWEKILFKSDKKLQTTEIEELQDLLLHQVNKAYNYIYDFFTVIKGCKIIVNSISSSEYQCFLTEGQVYIELLNQSGFFIDTPAKSLSINRLSTTYVGVKFNVTELQDDPFLNNPHTGGVAFGSKGSNRIIITSEIVTSSIEEINSYPLAIIKPKTNTFLNSVNDLGDGKPDIFYYKNQELERIHNQNILSKHLNTLISQRLYEISGDFISKGFNLLLNKELQTLSITPGIAYINGKKIQTTSNYNFKLNLDNDYGEFKSGFKYLIYLTFKGEFKLVEETLNNDYILEIPNNSINIGYLFLEGYDDLFQLKYNLVESNLRMPKVNDLINLNKANEKNTKELSLIASRIDLLNLSKNNLNRDLNGIFVDSFTDLNNSDIYHTEFNCAILPLIQAISLPFISKTIDNRLMSIDLSNSNIYVKNILSENNESIPYWSTVKGSSDTFFEDYPVTSYKQIPNSNNKSLHIRLSPSVIYKSDDNTFINYTNPILKNSFKNENIAIDTPLNDSIYNRTVNLFASGFNSYQDNIKVEINNVSITSISINTGSVGSTLGTVKADDAGNVGFNFVIPSLSKVDNYIISLSSGLNSISSEIKIIDPELERTSKESLNNFIIENNSNYTNINSGLGQVFNIEQPLMLEAVELSLGNFSSNYKGSILNVFIAKVNSAGIPTNEVLGYGTLHFSDLKFVNHSINSKVYLDKPIHLNRGKYIVVTQTSLDNVELGISSPSESSLGTNLTFNNQFSLGPLLVSENNNWSVINSEILNLKLIVYKPSNVFSSTIFNISNEDIEEFSVLDMNISLENLTKDSFVSIYVLDENGNFRIAENGYFFFKQPVTNTKVRVDLQGNANLHPILRLDNCSFTVIKNLEVGNWISKNQQYEIPYNNLTMSIDIFKPDSTTFKYYFSSDKGDTWEELNETNSTITTEVVDVSLPITKYTFTKNDLGFINNSLRYDLRYKIEIDNSNPSIIQPFFKNFISITTP